MTKEEKKAKEKQIEKVEYTVKNGIRRDYDLLFKIL